MKFIVKEDVTTELGAQFQRGEVYTVIKQSSLLQCHPYKNSFSISKVTAAFWYINKYEFNVLIKSSKIILL
jgi:hypothetical protein